MKKKNGITERKFELRECFVCHRKAYKCQVQINIIVWCGEMSNEKEKKNTPTQSSLSKRKIVGENDGIYRRQTFRETNKIEQVFIIALSNAIISIGDSL